jgi:hypothetical protein
VRSAKADSTPAAADSVSDVSGSQGATTKAATVEPTTTMEAPSTAATVSSGVYCWTECHAGDAN